MQTNTPNNPRFDVIEDLFFNYKKNPHKEVALFEKILKDTSEFDVDDLKSAIHDIKLNHNFFPNIMDIVQGCKSVKKVSPVSSYETVNCKKCGTIGLIYEARGRYEDGTTITLTDIHIPKKEIQYTSVAVGRCGCVNGERYTRMPIAEPLSFIMDLAIKNDTDCPFEAQELAKELNKKKRGLNE